MAAMHKDDSLNLKEVARILEETLSSSTILDLLRRYISTASTPETTASNTQPLAASTKVVVEGDEKKEAMLMVVVGVVMVVSERVKGVVVMTWPNKRTSMSPEEVVKRWTSTETHRLGDDCCGTMKGDDDDDKNSKGVVGCDMCEEPLSIGDSADCCLAEFARKAEADAIKEEATVKYFSHIKCALNAQQHPSTPRDEPSTSAASEDVKNLLHFPMSQAFTDPLKILHLKNIAQNDKETTEIYHWSHPAHPLILNVEDPIGNNMMPDINSGDPIKDCEFQLDMYCAMRSPQSLAHRYCKGHEIPLTYPPVDDHPEDFYCDIFPESVVVPKANVGVEIIIVSDGDGDDDKKVVGDTMDTVVAGTDEEIGSVAVGMSGFILRSLSRCNGRWQLEWIYTTEKAVQQASLEGNMENQLSNVKQSGNIYLVDEIDSVAVGMSGFILEACLGAMEGGSLEVDSNTQKPKDPEPKNTCLCIGVTPDYTLEKAVQQASLEGNMENQLSNVKQSGNMGNQQFIPTRKRQRIQNQKTS
ncbi:hypothetical protein Tco_0745377 [Tanacetum coccineum]